MIITLCCIIVGLLIALYIWSLYIEWFQLRHPETQSTIDLMDIMDTIKRDARKSMYFAERTFDTVQDISSRTAKNMFFKVFPQARDAFKNQDKLTGLTSGPSSYFLNELSDKPVKKASRRAQKSMQ